MLASVTRRRIQNGVNYCAGMTEAETDLCRRYQKWGHRNELTPNSSTTDYYFWVVLLLRNQRGILLVRGNMKRNVKSRLTIQNASYNCLRDVWSQLYIRCSAVEQSYSVECLTVDKTRRNVTVSCEECIILSTLFSFERINHPSWTSPLEGAAKSCKQYTL